MPNSGLITTSETLLTYRELKIPASEFAVPAGFALVGAPRLENGGQVSAAKAPAQNASLEMSEEERQLRLAAIRAEQARRARDRAALQQSPSTTRWQIADCVPSVVVVETSSGLGTGFYVAPDIIVTNAHVVGNDPTVRVRRNGEVTNGNVIAMDVGRDVAAVRVTAVGRPLTLAKDDPPLGAVIWVIGNPEGLESSVNRGSVSQVRVVPDRVGNKVRRIQHDAPTSPGSSGSPVIMDGGVVIGLHTYTRASGNSLNFSLHAAEVAASLRESGISIGGR